MSKSLINPSWSGKSPVDEYLLPDPYSVIGPQKGVCKWSGSQITWETGGAVPLGGDGQILSYNGNGGAGGPVWKDLKQIYQIEVFATFTTASAGGQTATFTNGNLKGVCYAAQSYNSADAVDVGEKLWTGGPNNPVICLGVICAPTMSKVTINTASFGAFISSWSISGTKLSITWWNMDTKASMPPFSASDFSVQAVTGKTIKLI